MIDRHYVEDIRKWYDILRRRVAGLEVEKTGEFIQLGQAIACLEQGVRNSRSTISIVENRRVYQVISNTDLTEGRGAPLIIATVISQTTARRLAQGKGVMGSSAMVSEVSAFRVGYSWYAPTHILGPSKEDQQVDDRAEKIAALKAKVQELDLTPEEIELLKELKG